MYRIDANKLAPTYFVPEEVIVQQSNANTSLGP